MNRRSARAEGRGTLSLGSGAVITDLTRSATGMVGPPQSARHGAERTEGDGSRRPIGGYGSKEGGGRHVGVVEMEDGSMLGGPDPARASHLRTRVRGAARKMTTALVAPSQLRLPMPEQMNAVLPHLSPEGTSAFLHEVLTALQAAQANNDLRPVQEVVEAWFRTLLLRQHPEHPEAIHRSTSGEPLLSADELRAELLA